MNSLKKILFRKSISTHVNESGENEAWDLNESTFYDKPEEEVTWCM